MAHIELDALHHGPNWAEPTAEEFCQKVRSAMNSRAFGWVIDGNYERKLGSLVTDAADSVVWLNLPLALGCSADCGAAHLASRIRDHVELWNGNHEDWRSALWGRDSLFGWTIRAHFRHRRDYPRLYGADPRFVRLRSVAEARRWLDAQSG